MARKKRTNDSNYFADWLRRAREDLIAASVLKENNQCYNSAAFHCQQTAEKALKAYILFVSDRLVDGHNLSWLTKQANRYNDFNQWFDEAAALNRCYIETRYPADIPFSVTQKQVESYYKMAYEMFIFICKEMELDKIIGELD